MAYEKDSAILVIQTTEDGYFMRVFSWNQSPPPIGQDLATAIDIRSGGGYSFRQDRVSSTKTELKQELQTFIDSRFDL